VHFTSPPYTRLLLKSHDVSEARSTAIMNQNANNYENYSAGYRSLDSSVGIVMKTHALSLRKCLGCGEEGKGAKKFSQSRGGGGGGLFHLSKAGDGWGWHVSVKAGRSPFI